MTLGIKTSDLVVELILHDEAQVARDIWQTERNMAVGLLERIESFLTQQNLSWQELNGIVAYKGPGSFTSLRIGLTIANSLSYSLHIPIVGVSGDNWSTEGLQRLQTNENDVMVMPHYGAEPHITSPRK